MLSYKLKHLCSQVFASLAAFGLFSLGAQDEARAVVKDPSTTFNFAGTAANFSVTATYSDACTIPSTFKGISGAEYVTGAGSGAGSCKYFCKPGYYYREGSSDVTTVTGVTGSAGSGSFVPGGECYPKPKSCTNATWSGTNVYITSTNNAASVGFDAGKGYYCKATCKDGFGTSATAGAGTSQKSSYATSTGDLTVAACVGRNFTMKVDCGASGVYSGTSSSYSNQTVQYGMKITLPSSGACVKPGYTFSGFSVPDTVAK